MNPMKKTVFFILTLITVNTLAQDIRFEQITNESGRSLGFVSGMVQDSTGFIWLATRNGLYRYDGYSYKLFKYNRKDSLSIPYNDLTYLYLDNQENLWMRHYNKLFAFTNEKLNFNFKAITDKSFDITTQILQDKFQQYWIGPFQGKVLKYDGKHGKLDTFSLSTKLVHPSIEEWLRQTKPTEFTTSEKKISIKNKQTFLIISTGEGSNETFYDYGSLLQNGSLVYDAKEHFTQMSKKSLLHLAYSIIDLEPGEYTLKFEQDDSNSFDSVDIPMQRYGIALYAINSDSEIAKLAAIDYYPDNSIHAEIIKNQIINNNGLYTILTENGLHEYMGDAWFTTSLDLNAIVGKSYKSDSYSMPLTQMSDGSYWIGYHNGVIEVNESGTHVHQIFDSPAKLYNISSDRFGRIWLASSKGMFRYDSKSGQTIHINQTNKNRLYSNQVWDMLEDKSKNLWVATMEGLNKLRPAWFEHVALGMNNYSPFPIVQYTSKDFVAAGQSPFLHFFKLNSSAAEKLALPSDVFPVDEYSNEAAFDVTDLLIEGDTIYLAYDNRIALFRQKGKEFIKYIELTNLEIGEQSVDNHALYIFSEQQIIWVAAIDGLYAFDNQLEIKLNFIPFGNTYSSILDLDNRYVKDVARSQGDWIIRTASEILKFNPKSLTITKIFDFPERIMLTSLADGNVYVDSVDQQIWFSALPNIYRMKVDTDDIDTLRINLDVDLGDCNTYRFDSLIWITTNNGLVRFNPQSNEFVRYTTSDGLSDNNVNNLFPDTHGNMWIAGLKGLSKLNIATEQFENFFRSNDFNVYRFLGKHFRHPVMNNQILLPTTSGYFKFNPDSLNPYAPNLVVSKIYLFGKETEFDSLSYQKKTIDLPFKKNFITFELASLDFTEPSKNKFRYKLLNFNDQWTYSDAIDRKAPYTGLPPGDYVFVAQGTNNDGLWSDSLRVRVIIHPPWYRTIVAYIAYILISVLSIVFFIRYRERKLKYEKKVLEQKVQERTVEIRKQRDEIVAQKKDITDSIHYASKIQAALLPTEEFAKTVLDSYFILFKPRDIVSGDYYWLAQVDKKTILVAADCTGHGVPGAFMSMLGVAFLNEVVIRDGTTTANKILDKLREHVIKSLKQTGQVGGSKDGMDLSLLIIDHETLNAEFAGAYNPLYLIRNGELETIKADKMPIGYHIKVGTPFSNNELSLEKGDRLYMFSDGYPDQFGGEKGRKFMSKQFKQLLLDTSMLEMHEQKQILDETMEAWKGEKHSQIDDILVIGVKI